MALTRLGRPNLLHRREEAWTPPPLTNPTGTVARAAAWARRFMDLQTSSIHDDLARVLPRVRGVLLDVGCGAQPYRPLLDPAVRYRGIDTTGARAWFGYDAPDTTYFSGDRWPVRGNSVDWILCTETLEHIPDPARFLGEARRCLRPGGRLVLTVPFAARWHFIRHDFWRYTPMGLERLLTRAGFDAIEVAARGNSITVAAYKVMAPLLRMLFPQVRSAPLRWVLRLAGLPLLPVAVGLAALAQVSLRFGSGDDCLGYTAFARRRAGTRTARRRSRA